MKFGNNTAYEWGDAQVNAFQELGSRVMSVFILNYPDFKIAYHSWIACDASIVGIVAALLQYDPCRHMPIAFAPELLLDLERRMFSDGA